MNTHKATAHVAAETVKHPVAISRNEAKAIMFKSSSTSAVAGHTIFIAIVASIN